jgi:hypothetical protein
VTQAQKPNGKSPEQVRSNLQRSFIRTPWAETDQPTGRRHRAETRLEQDFSRVPASATRGAVPSTAETLQRAASEAARPLEGAVREPLEHSLGYSLRTVRVRSGAASAAAADQLDARAYTLGNNIHLGAEARHLGQGERRRLLAHEAVHTIQQGGRSVKPSGNLAVSHPADATEAEAARIAASATTPAARRTPSPSLALRDRFRANAVSHTAPLIQRDLKGKYPTRGGDFTLDLKTESHPGAKNGMSGTIKFKASEKAPDSSRIRLLQVVRDQDLTTGKDYVWSGAEADRNKMMTTAAPGVQPGFFVDHSAAAAGPRTKKSDLAVSPYYRDYWPNPSSSQDGSKKGKNIKEASLWDYPGSGGNRRFSFETVAKAADTGHVYGTVMWGFTISDASKGKVEKERAVGRNVTLLTTDKAIEKFDEFYRNPGASTAP